MLWSIRLVVVIFIFILLQVSNGDRLVGSLSVCTLVAFLDDFLSIILQLISCISDSWKGSRLDHRIALWTQCGI